MREGALTELKDLVSPWPARGGLSVIRGDRAWVSTFENMLVHFFNINTMDSPTSSVGPVFWVDSGNFFNAYHMAALAQHQGWDPKVALRALRLARPFTAFQFQKMLGKIPGPTPLKTPLVFVSDLMGLFYEEEIQEADVNRAFREFLKQLLTLKQRAMVLALLLDHSIPPARRALLPRVLALVDHVHTSFQERLAA